MGFYLCCFFTGQQQTATHMFFQMCRYRGIWLESLSGSLLWLILNAIKEKKTVKPSLAFKIHKQKHVLSFGRFVPHFWDLTQHNSHKEDLTLQHLWH